MMPLWKAPLVIFASPTQVQSSQKSSKGRRLTIWMSEFCKGRSAYEDGYGRAKTKDSGGGIALR